MNVDDAIIVPRVCIQSSWPVGGISIHKYFVSYECMVMILPIGMNAQLYD